MNSPRVELPDFDKFAVSFDELLQKGITVKVQKGNGNGKGGKGGGSVTAKRSHPHLILDPATFRERYPWTDIPSPATSIHGEEASSTKELEVVPRPPLYKDKKRVVVFVGLMLAWLFKGFDDTVITTIVPALCRKFDSLPQIAWFSAAYFLPQACLYIGFGKLAQVTNLRWMALFDGLVLTIGSVICIIASSAPVFIIGRVVTGIGIAAGVPLCATILIDITSPGERATYMASCVGVDVISLAFGALLGGYLETNMDYRWAFAFTIFGAIVSVGLIAAAYEQPPRETDGLPASEHLRRFDFFGFSFLSMFSVLLLIGIQLAAQNNQWVSAPVIACLATSALMFSCFVLQQAKYDDPDNRLLPRGLFNRDVSLLMAFGFFVMFAMYGVYYYLSTYFQTVKGLSSFDAAVSLLAFFLASGFSSIATGASMMWLPYANIIILIASTLAVVGTFLLTTMNEYTEPLHAGLLSIISAVGFGASQTLAIVFSQSWAAPKHQSFIVSVALMVQLFGGTLGLVLGGSVLNTQILYRVEELDGQLTGDQISAVTQALAMPDRIREFVPDDLIEPLLSVFSSSIQTVFYACSAAVSIAWILSVCMRWHKLK